MVGQELFQTALGERMFQQSQDGGKRTRDHVGPGIHALHDMAGMADGGGQHPGSESVGAIDADDVRDQLYAVLRDVVEAPDKG